MFSLACSQVYRTLVARMASLGNLSFVLLAGPKKDRILSIDKYFMARTIILLQAFLMTTGAVVSVAGLCKPRT